MKYYVYIYFDTRLPCNYSVDGLIFNYTPVYVGKGKDGTNRHLSHMNKGPKTKLRNLIKHLKANNQKIEYRIVRFFSTEEESHAYETKLIRLIGREDKGCGSLYNLTDGGEGSSGCVWSEDKRKNLSKFKREWWQSLNEEDRKKIGEQSLLNRNRANIRRGTEKCKETKSRWSEEYKLEVESKRYRSWKNSYCNTGDKQNKRSERCKSAGLRRKMFFLTYTIDNTTTIESNFLKDLISMGCKKDALEWRIKGKTPLSKPYKIKALNKTITIISVEKKPYSVDS